MCVSYIMQVTRRLDSEPFWKAWQNSLQSLKFVEGVLSHSSTQKLFEGYPAGYLKAHLFNPQKPLRNPMYQSNKDG